MREYEYIARQRYLNDPQYHNLVNLLESLMDETGISPNEFHDAVNLAADRHKADYYEIKKLQPKIENK
ncbi:hypothetical protein [Pelosinus sp. IPA-1]|uniref:hypothetical protein n=1 Tax=Pelosinus sp. IPA-1 TaxID=3029569 RepID=UPI00243629C8|nr:hypothetical protein [Pelosinus sp. IPA-1]GMB01058.1 hypothetical protein PIPA1_38570 [Pelosinus sp. IPA-1]